MAAQQRSSESHRWHSGAAIISAASIQASEPSRGIIDHAVAKAAGIAAFSTALVTGTVD